MVIRKTIHKTSMVAIAREIFGWDFLDQDFCCTTESSWQLHWAVADSKEAFQVLIEHVFTAGSVPCPRITSWICAPPLKTLWRESSFRNASRLHGKGLRKWSGILAHLTETEHILQRSGFGFCGHFWRYLNYAAMLLLDKCCSIKVSELDKGKAIAVFDTCFKFAF